MTQGVVVPWFVAIGASGGDGLHDIEAILRELPPLANAAVLIVLHRPWDKPSHLTEILRMHAHMPVRVAEDGQRFAMGTIYVGEPADHLTLAANTFGRLLADPERAHRNRTVDLLFRSVAVHGGGRIIGIILSGGLDDGARGLANINEVGGLTMVVRRSPTIHPGMPENAIGYDGPIDLIGTPSEIAQSVCAAIQLPNTASA